MDSSLVPRVSRRRLLGTGAGAAVAVGVGLMLPRSSAAVPLTGVTGTVNVDQLNVRSGPSTSRAVVGRVSRGATVSCIQTSSEWFKIQTSKVTGWVHSPSITLVPRNQVTTFGRGRTDRKLVALTFDAGADRGFAASILDTLAAKRVTASFGITGQWAKANGDLLRRIVVEGHLLINHTLTHRSMTGVSGGGNVADTPAERLAELMATEIAFTNAIGRGAIPWFRPPYGDYNASVVRDIAAVGFTYNVMWTVDSLGWNGLTRDQIISRCLGNHGNGYIYLFHVGAQSQDGPALAAIIDGLRSRGYTFGDVAQALGVAAPPPTGEDARISISPLSGPVGATIAVSGTGFLPNEPVRLYWDSTSSSALVQVTASGTGTFVTSVLAQEDEAGRHLVAAKGTISGWKASRSFTLSDEPAVPTPTGDDARIAIVPASGPAGTAIQVSGHGFRPGEIVGLYWDSTFSPALTTVTADASGAFAGLITAQEGDAGRHLVAAKGLTSGWKASRSFGLDETAVAESTAMPTPAPTPTSTAPPGGTPVAAT